MIALYNFLLPLLVLGIRVASLFDPKIRRGLAGRKKLLEETRKHYAEARIRGRRILIHVASFGELEQAKPIISALKAKDPEAHIHLTFFSPSGYENVIGKYDGADFITYSPADRRKNVLRFLDSVQPQLALFTRYDVWPNMARELKRRNIPSILFAATAAESTARKLPVARSFYRDTFRALSKILTVSEEDKSRFESFGLDPQNIVVAGDTRFDQVKARRDALEMSGEHLLPERICTSVEERGTLVLVVGSSWPSDEAIYLPTLIKSIERKDNILTIIAPHETDEARIEELLAKFSGNAIRYSKIDEWSGEQVIVVDGIGKLFGLYRYADIAMIGGGFGAGLHNILEAAVWDAPAIVGPKHQKSREVGELIDRIGAFEVSTQREFNFVFWRLAESEDLRKSSGEEAARFIQEHRGATERILSEL
jgi:3-deoxy-D-manno-octulosonic-acid transferase